VLDKPAPLPTRCLEYGKKNDKGNYWVSLFFQFATDVPALRSAAGDAAGRDSVFWCRADSPTDLAAAVRRALASGGEPEKRVPIDGWRIRAESILGTLRERGLFAGADVA
jgi:hypothetical protein